MLLKALFDMRHNPSTQLPPCTLVATALIITALSNPLLLGFVYSTTWFHFLFSENKEELDNKDHYLSCYFITIIKRVPNGQASISSLMMYFGAVNMFTATFLVTDI
jgi:hypothetical protein